MNDHAKEIRRRLKLAQADLEYAQNELEKLERSCFHDWTDPVYDPIEHKGYHIPEWKKGSDYQSFVDVPSITEDQWKHTCKKCGKVETTKSVRTEKNIPVF